MRGDVKAALIAPSCRSLHPLMVFLIACRPTQGASPSAPTPTEAPHFAAAELVAAPQSEPEAVPKPEIPAPATSPEDIKTCVKQHLIAGPELVKTWPSLVGRQVALNAEVVRAVDMAQLVVKAQGEQFLVVAMPGQTWPGPAVRLFTVIGRGMAHVRGGPQHLAQLMLVDDTSCEPADLE